MTGCLTKPKQGLQRRHHAVTSSHLLDHLGMRCRANRVIGVLLLLSEGAPPHHLGAWRQLCGHIHLEPPKQEGLDAGTQMGGHPRLSVRDGLGISISKVASSAKQAGIGEVKLTPELV